MAKFIFRIILLGILLMGIYLFEAFPALYQGLIKKGELNPVDAVQVLIGKKMAPDHVDLFWIHNRLQPLADEFIYEDNSKRIFVHTDASGNPIENQSEHKVFKVVSKTLYLDIWSRSYIPRFFLHWIGLALVILWTLKDFILDLLERTAPAREQKRKAKQAKSLLVQATKMMESKQYQKLVDKMGKPEDRAGLTSEDSDKIEWMLAIAYLKLNNADKGIPMAAKAKNRDESGELAIELGAFLSRNPAKAKAQDLNYLCAYLEANPSDSDFAKFFADFCLKHKLNDKKALSLLIKHLESLSNTEAVRNFILQALLKDRILSSEAIAFYELCKIQDPENVEPYLILAEYKTEKNLYKEALDDLEKLLNLDYENQVVHDLLFNLHKNNSRLSELYQIYSNVLDQVPDEAIALTQQRKIKADPDFDQSKISKFEKLTMQELFARKQTIKDEAELAEIEEVIEKRKKFLTIMFTDIKGYTKLSEKYPNDMMRVVLQGDQILPPTINKHGGIVIKKIGDAYMARFDNAKDAIVAAMQIQQLIIENNRRRAENDVFPWEIRIGINTGWMYDQNGDVFGDEVNVASRVESSGEPNHVFCTEATIKALSDNTFKFEFVGEKEVKGKSLPIKLFRLTFDPNKLDPSLAGEVFSNEIFNS